MLLAEPGAGSVAGRSLTSPALCRWLWRQRIRLHLEGTGINPTPVDLHEQQLSLEQHNQAHRISTSATHRGTPPPFRSSVAD